MILNTLPLVNMFHEAVITADTFYLGRLGGVAASASLTRGFNGPLILSLLYPLMT